MAKPFEILAQAKLTRDTTEQFTGLEIDLLGGRSRLTSGVVVDLRDIGTSIKLRIASYRVVIQNTQNFCHHFLLLLEAMLSS
jgi:hypothetical protein